MTVRILNADVMDGLAQLEDESVHCVVTSPPYWGLRDYGMPGQLGLEPTLSEHIEAMVRVFREVRRVLRRNGTLWLNYGDSYATSANGRSAADTKKLGNDDRTFRDKPFSTVGSISRVGKSLNKGDSGSDCIDRGKRTASRWGGGNNSDETLKPKDLCGVPWRIAFALQADGWWLRQDIIWSKPNPMPESIKDRCTKAHEYLFLLAKSERYYFDAEAIAEAVTSDRPDMGGCPMDGVDGPIPWEGSTRNKRSVWEIATSPFPEAHFATFPPALIEPCIKAGSKIGDTVLDCFGGSGTTGLVSDRLKRNAILIEISGAYCEMAHRRITGDCPMFVDVGT